MRPITAIAVNTETVKEVDYPKSWTDLFDPKWKGKIGMPSMDAGGSAAQQAGRRGRGQHAAEKIV